MHQHLRYKIEWNHNGPAVFNLEGLYADVAFPHKADDAVIIIKSIVGDYEDNEDLPVNCSRHEQYWPDWQTEMEQEDTWGPGWDRVEGDLFRHFAREKGMPTTEEDWILELGSYIEWIIFMWINVWGPQQQEEEGA